MRKTQVMNLSQGKDPSPSKQSDENSEPKICERRQDQEELIIDQNNGNTTYTVKSEEKTMNYLKDIALFYDKVEKLTDNENYEILEKLWKPREDFEFSVTVQGKKNRKFVHKWLNGYRWLAYSKILNGAFCICCVLSGKRIGPNSHKLDRLLKSLFRCWVSAKVRFDNHERKSTIHQTLVSTMLKFKKVMQDQIKPLPQIFEKSRQDRIAIMNQQKLKPIIETVVFFVGIGTITNIYVVTVPEIFKNY